MCSFLSPSQSERGSVHVKQCSCLWHPQGTRLPPWSLKEAFQTSELVNACDVHRPKPWSNLLGFQWVNECAIGPIHAGLQVLTPMQIWHTMCWCLDGLEVGKTGWAGMFLLLPRGWPLMHPSKIGMLCQKRGQRHAQHLHTLINMYRFKFRNNCYSLKKSHVARHSGEDSDQVTCVCCPGGDYCWTISRALLPLLGLPYF